MNSDGSETDLISMFQMKSEPILTDDPDEIDTNLLPYDSDGIDICGDMNETNIAHQLDSRSSSRTMAPCHVVSTVMRCAICALLTDMFTTFKLEEFCGCSAFTHVGNLLPCFVLRLLESSLTFAVFLRTSRILRH